MTQQTPASSAPASPLRPTAPGLRGHVVRTALIGSLAVALLCGGLLAHSIYDYARPARKWGVVEPDAIYRSGHIATYRIERDLHEHQVDVIIDLQGFDKLDPRHLAEREAIERLGIESHRYPLAGNGTGDITMYADAIAMMVDARKRGKRILVHCAAGAQRTGGVIACYRMLVEGRTPAEARAELPLYGWRPEKDAILLNYVNESMPQLIDLLIERGVLKQRPDRLPQLPTR